MRSLTSFALFIALSILATGAANGQAPYPRLAALWLGSQNYEDPNIQRQLARGDIALISYWPGWESGRGTTLEQVVRNIKAINPRTQVFVYVVNEGIPIDRARTQPYAEIYAKLDAERWYLYTSGQSGQIVPSFWAGNHTTNNTLFTPPDSNGDRFVDWYAKWAVRNHYAPNPSIDGFLTDNVFVRPRVDGDFNLDGTMDDRESAIVGTWQRQGLRRHFDVLRQLMPGKYQLGNNADFGDDTAVFPELDQQMNGGLMEGLIGYEWSFEEWGGWDMLMRAYRKTMASYAAPKLGVFGQTGNPTDYQSFRYGFASCLLDDGYFAFNADSGYADAPNFDEYSVRLGQAMSGPVTTAWQSGVYRRDFENGIVLVNPKGNGSRTVQLEGDFRRISGSQAPNVNNGQLTRSVTLNDRDGIVLLRTGVVSKPNPPAAVVVQ
jgi:hypothetical protein